MRVPALEVCKGKTRFITCGVTLKYLVNIVMKCLDKNTVVCWFVYNIDKGLRKAM